MGIELKRKPTSEEIEQICVAAEAAARKHVLSKISLKWVSDLDVMVEAVGDKPLMINIELGIELTTGGHDLESLVKEATEAAFSAAEAKARELDLCVDTRA